MVINSLKGFIILELKRHKLDSTIFRRTLLDLTMITSAETLLISFNNH
jgi:hypothetical protein